MRAIRPRRSGFILFVSRIASVATGLIFLVMVTRWLTPQQFGLWEFLLDIIVFASYPVGFITFWATRDTARGLLVGRTAIYLSLALSLVGMVLFYLISVFTHAYVGSAFLPFVVALVLVPLNYLSTCVSSLVSGYDPAITGYSLFFSEIVKVAFAYYFLYIIKIGIFGVIFSVSISYLAQSLISIYFLSPLFKERVNISVARRWFSFYHVPAINMLNSTLSVADTFAASIGQGSTVVAGFYQAAFQVATVVGYSSFLANALYPLLLRQEKEGIVGEITDFFFLFAIPMAAGAISIGRSLLFFLKPVYVLSYFPLVVLCIASVIAGFSNILDFTLMGRERADIANDTARIVKSNLMFVSLSNLAYYSFYVLSVFLISYASRGIEPYSTALFWSLSQLLLLLALVLVKLMKARTQVEIKLSPSFPRYFISSTAMSLIVYYLSSNVSTAEGIELGISLLLVILAGIASYFALLFAIDSRFRVLVRSFFRSIRAR